jgi:hypothetical protein
MLENGNLIMLMGKENLSIIVAMYMKENGKETEQMEREYIKVKMEEYIKDNGWMINNMGMELSCGVKDQNMKETILWD